MDNIQEQIRALQTSVRRQRFATVAAIGMCVLTWQLAASPQQNPYAPASSAFDPAAPGLQAARELAELRVRLSQQILDIRGEVEQVLNGRANMTFGTVTCNRLIITDQAKRPRIDATWMDNGDAGIQFIDKGGVRRILAATYANDDAGVQWFDKSGKKRIDASTAASGAVIFPAKADK